MRRLMDASPPRPRSRVTLANLRTSPFNRWAFHYVRELAESGLGLIADYPWSAPYEDLKLKGK